MCPQNVILQFSVKQLVSQLQMCPQNVIAILDCLIRQKPNANTIALEAMIMYSQNKTAACNWIQKKSVEEKGNLLQAARTLVPIVKEKFKSRKQEIQKQLENDLVRRQEDIAKKQYKKLQVKEKTS